MSEIFLCSSCGSAFPANSRIVVPWRNDTMGMLVTAYVCGSCLPQAIQRAKADLAKTQGRGLGGMFRRRKRGRAIEDFVGFIERHRLDDVAVAVKSADCPDSAIETLNGFLDDLCSRQIVLDA